MKILVIDDRPENVESAKKTLAGHQLTVATTVQEAFDILFAWGVRGEREGFDVVLTDLNMPLGRFTGYDRGSFVGQDAGGKEEKQIYRQSEEGKIELPAGVTFALAAANLGALVGICSDRNHHRDWSTALLDLTAFDWRESGRRVATFYTPSPKNWGEALRMLLREGKKCDGNYCKEVQ